MTPDGSFNHTHHDAAHAAWTASRAAMLADRPDVAGLVERLRGRQRLAGNFLLGYTSLLQDEDCSEAAAALDPAPAARCQQFYGIGGDTMQCDLPEGHRQNHRVTHAHGSAQWPTPDLVAARETTRAADADALEACVVCHEIPVTTVCGRCYGLATMQPPAPQAGAWQPTEFRDALLQFERAAWARSRRAVGEARARLTGITGIELSARNDTARMVPLREPAPPRSEPPKEG